MHERPQDTRGITPGGWSRCSRRIKPPKQRDPLDNASLHRILIPHTVPCSPRTRSAKSCTIPRAIEMAAYPQFQAFFQVSKLVLKTLADSVKIDVILLLFLFKVEIVGPQMAGRTRKNAPTPPCSGGMGSGSGRRGARASWQRHCSIRIRAAIPPRRVGRGAGLAGHARLLAPRACRGDRPL